MNFDALEKKLNIASSLIDELDLDNYEIAMPEIATTTALAVINPEEYSDEIFSVETLKKDFIIIRQSVMKLIATGQRVLDTISLIDPSDLKGPQISAISGLIQTLGVNSKLMVDIYKEIVMIEKTRSQTKAGGGAGNGTQQSGLVNQGTVNNNNIIFSGSTENLLSFLKENQNP